MLCAHREGPYGVRHWNRQVQIWLSEETGQPPWSEWYPGRPLLVTANDYGLRVYNGDTGVAVAGPEGLRAVIAGAGGPLEFATSRLSDIETMHAMTIHKSQGSQADEVTVVMPTVDSRLLTRELFYTAVTRAKRKVRVVGSDASVRAAIERRAVRASGLARWLQVTPPIHECNRPKRVHHRFARSVQSGLVDRRPCDGTKPLGLSANDLLH